MKNSFVANVLSQVRDSSDVTQIKKSMERNSLRCKGKVVLHE